MGLAKWEIDYKAYAYNKNFTLLLGAAQIYKFTTFSAKESSYEWAV